MNACEKIETSLIKLNVEQRGNGLWVVTYDGRFIGDDRGYSDRELAEQALRKRLERDARDAITYNRPLLYTA